MTQRDGRVAREQESHLPGGELTRPQWGRVDCGRSSSPLCSVQEDRQGQAASFHQHAQGIRKEAVMASPKSALKSSLPFQQ